MHTYGDEVTDPELVRLNKLGFSEDPFVFADIVDSPGMVRVVDPKEMEIRECPMSEFSNGDVIAFAKVMRKYRPWLNDLPIRLPRELLPGIDHVRKLKERSGI